MIDSFTQKIEKLQSVIGQQKAKLDIKDKEINKLKQINEQLMGSSKQINESNILSPSSGSYQDRKNETFDSKQENQGLRKFLTSKEP